MNLQRQPWKKQLLDCEFLDPSMALMNIQIHSPSHQESHLVNYHEVTEKKKKKTTLDPEQKHIFYGRSFFLHFKSVGRLLKKIAFLHWVMDLAFPESSAPLRHFSLHVSTFLESHRHQFLPTQGSLFAAYLNAKIWHWSLAPGTSASEWNLMLALGKCSYCFLVSPLNLDIPQACLEGDCKLKIEPSWMRSGMQNLG